MDSARDSNGTKGKAKYSLEILAVGSSRKALLGTVSKQSLVEVEITIDLLWELFG
jgi:hypothetical protein